MATDQLSTTFAALADPTRRAILSRLAEGEASVTELARPFDLSLPGISKHLKVLQHAGLVRQSRKAQWRPCRLDGARLKEAADWVGEYRQFWEESFERLDEYLATVQKEETHDSEGRHQDGKD
ncbi:MAG: helix-turn-helix transcriptional regulator [Chloroflexi bacterium]|nr:MAG: helix-turn-helix transcriptional regulator [Chloroflexota bacterium]TMF99555.1 MAG: helix-turn-helix transcriptional regulator [Chloroflexota bacterium]